MIALRSFNKQNIDRAKTKKNNTKPVLNFIDDCLSDGEESTILYKLNRHS